PQEVLIDPLIFFLLLAPAAVLVVFSEETLQQALLLLDRSFWHTALRIYLWNLSLPDRRHTQRKYGLSASNFFEWQIMHREYLHTDLLQPINSHLRRAQ